MLKPFLHLLFLLQKDKMKQTKGGPLKFYHLQNWLQKLSLVEMVQVRDSFSYNKEIVLVLLLQLNRETPQCIVSFNCAIY